jgi:hypothetical protein
LGFAFVSPFVVVRHRRNTNRSHREPPSTQAPAIPVKGIRRMTSMRRRLRNTAGITVAMIILSSLSGNVSARELSAVLRAGELRVGASGNYKPVSFRDPDGSYRNADVRMARSLGVALGVRVGFVPTTRAHYRRTSWLISSILPWAACQSHRRGKRSRPFRRRRYWTASGRSPAVPTEIGLPRLLRLVSPT